MIPRAMLFNMKLAGDDLARRLCAMAAIVDPEWTAVNLILAKDLTGPTLYEVLPKGTILTDDDFEATP